MSRKLLALLAAALLVLSLATYVYYRRTLAAVPLDPYALVPDDAVLVLATRDHPALVRHLQEAGVWDNITGVRYYQQAAGHLALADSLDNPGSAAPPPPALLTGIVPRRRRGLLELLGNKLVLTSLHLTGPGQVDLLYQVPLATVREYRQARGLLEALGRDPRYSLATREYEGYELQELTARQGGRLTVLDYRNHLVLSTNAALVEAVVQRLRHPEAATVRTGFARTDLLRLRDVDATVLVNFRRLPGLLDVLFQPGTHAQLDQALTLAHEGLLGLRFGPGQVTLTGFANPETAAASWQRQLQGQPPQALRPLADVLSLRTALVLSVAGQLGVGKQDSAVSLSGRAALDSLRATLVPGATLAYLAAPAPRVPAGRLVLVHCRAVSRAQYWLAQLRRSGQVSPGFSRVGAYEVHEAGFALASLLGPLSQPTAPEVPGTPLATAVVGSYLVLGESTELRTYLADVAAGQVWSRSASQVALLQQTLPQARLTVLADVRQGWNALLGALSEDRRGGLLRNENLFRHFPQVAWQLLPPDQTPDETRPGSQYFAQLLLRRPGQGLAADTALATGTGTRFRRALAGQPLLLPALPAADGTLTMPVIVADSAGVLRMLPASAALPAWADSLPGPVVGQGPRLVRGRLLLATPHHLHWLNPTNGIQAPNFPLNLPDTATIAYVAAAPAAGSAPHLLVATTSNDLLLFDTNGHQYSGWPRHLEAPLAGPPLLLSVGGRDVLVAALRNGYLYAFDQAGGRYPGFPVSTGAQLNGPLLAEASNTLARSLLRVVNQHGELLTITLSGDVVGRRRVATWSPTASFRLVPDANSRPGSYVVVRQDGGLLDVFAAAATTPAAPLLHRQLLTSGEKPVQWFDFGSGHQALAITEPGPAQMWLFDGQGRALGAAPGLPTAWPSTGTGVALRYDANRQHYQLLRLVNKELRRDEVGR
ncbi:MAG: hypothetical protein ACRYFX_14795 [Janthinobacterium lividum]